MNPRLSSTLIVLGLLAVWTLAGWLMFRSSFSAHRRAVASRTWPEAAGTVTESRTDSRMITVHQRSQTVPAPHITYRYAVSGKEFSGSRIRFDEIPGDETGDVLARFPSGAAVMVRYNPDDPSDSVLQPPAEASWLPESGRLLFICYVALPLVVLGFIFMAVALSGKASRDTALAALAAISDTPAGGGEAGRQAIATARGILCGKRQGTLGIQCSRVISRNDPDMEFSESTRIWSLMLSASSVTVRRWMNLASMVGASQSAEIEATAAPGAPLPPAAADWLPSLLAALKDPDARVRFSDAGK